MKHSCPTDGCCWTCDHIAMATKGCLPCDVSEARTRGDCEMCEGIPNKEEPRMDVTEDIKKLEAETKEAQRKVSELQSKLFKVKKAQETLASVSTESEGANTPCSNPQVYRALTSREIGDSLAKQFEQLSDAIKAALSVGRYTDAHLLVNAQTLLLKNYEIYGVK